MSSCRTTTFGKQGYVSYSQVCVFGSFSRDAKREKVLFCVEPPSSFFSLKCHLSTIRLLI